MEVGIMPTRKALENPNRPLPAPVEYTGQWVAWNKERTIVLAHGSTLAEASDAAKSVGYPDALFERVRRPDELIVGRL